MVKTQSSGKDDSRAEEELPEDIKKGLDGLTILTLGISSGLSSSEIEEALKKIEIWQGDIQGYERYKRCAYEFIPPPKNTEEKPRFLNDKYGIKQFTSFYSSFEENRVSKSEEGYYATVDFEKSLEDGLEAFVNFKIDTEIKGKPGDSKFSVRRDYYGLPVRKAKGKWLRNLMLKYFY